MVSQPKPYSKSKNPRGYWISEKYDGVRASWNGVELVTKHGNRIEAPAWWTARLPIADMDGELWAGRGKFQAALNLITSPLDLADWGTVRLMTFDAPMRNVPMSERQEILASLPKSESWAKVDHVECEGREHMMSEFARVDKAGGEGIVLHHPDTYYERGPTWTMMKLKRRDDSEGRVVGHNEAGGHWAGTIGSLRIATDDGAEFSLNGLPDAVRSAPPPLGERVSFWHMGFTGRGIPRQARWHRVRGDS